MRAGQEIFAGSIPAVYETLMVPMLFAPFAEELAARAKASRPGSILETACGTGIVTRAVHQAVPDAEIIATDLNPGMLRIAAEKLRSPRVRFFVADAQQLPFDDAGFDLVLCQFGVMFFPDRIAAHREAHRLLRPGGCYQLMIWDRLDRNPASLAIHQAVAAQFPADPPDFLPAVPFCHSDLDSIAADLMAAGFSDLEFETIQKRSRSASASDAAKAMCEGSPLRSEIEARDPDSLGRVTKAVADALRPFEGPGGFDAPMSAHLASAVR